MLAKMTEKDNVFQFLCILEMSGQMHTELWGLGN